MNNIPSPLSPKREAFAQGIASGKSATRSYIDAGYSEYGADGAACKLQGIASISARIEELRKENQEHMNMTRIEWLSALQERALALPIGLPITARYFELIGKAQGWFDYEKQPVQQPVQQPEKITSDWVNNLKFDLSRRGPVTDEDDDLSDIQMAVLPL